MIHHILKITNERQNEVEYTVFYTTKDPNRTTHRTYGRNDNLPMSAVKYLTDERTFCRTAYDDMPGGIQKRELFAQCTI